MKLRELSDELRKKAEDELNEEPERIVDDVNHIKEWLNKQPHLIARTEHQWLVTFLRGCKYSLQRTKEKLDIYYTVRSLAPEYFKVRDPFSPGVQKLLELGVCLPLNKLKDPGAPRAILLRPGIYNPSDTKLEDVFKLYLIVHDILLNEDDNFIIAGEHILQDMKGVNLTHTKIMSPSLMKKAMTCFQEAYPLRVKGIHFVNTSTFFETFYTFIKPFVSEKIKSRMSVSGKDGSDDLYKLFPKSILPAEYGGTDGTVAELTLKWKKKVEGYKDWLAEDCQFRTQEDKRPGKPKTSEALFGLEGSFRKLDID